MLDDKAIQQISKQTFVDLIFRELIPDVMNDAKRDLESRILTLSRKVVEEGMFNARIDPASDNIIMTMVIPRHALVR